ncbi:pilus assembly protein TadG-related protein [Streptomyces sp. NRRL S-87]|uniref:pilus assembly protein TadG-related protein n=1 Tax=Streptomyces sp. NRRL S-87 TaxID=1463920 RepID=UPI00099B6358|nr:pilus assembly protein TadG-related protein [Streptomyces sp. NRRL S-87]
MPRCFRSDRGQAFPMYAWMMGGLLFAVIAFFAIGQAGARRNETQGAADAAALAAAQAARDELASGWDLSLLQRDDWERLLEGGAFNTANSCAAAETFAKANGASLTSCGVGAVFAVRVRASEGIGNPKVTDVRATAGASAEIKPRCEIATWDDPQKPFDITCKGRRLISLDPSHLDPWRTLARTLFDVRLVD